MTEGINMSGHLLFYYVGAMEKVGGLLICTVLDRGGEPYVWREILLFYYY